MLAPTPARTLTSADLKDNLHDIQDNVVAPILMRYGRHIFREIQRRRQGARMAAQHVQARQRPGERAWDTFHRQYRLHLRRPESAGTFSTIARQLPRGVSGRHAGPCACGGRCRAARAGTLGGRPRRSRHSRDGAGFAPIPTEGREEATRIIRAEMEATGGVEIRFVQDTMALAHENGIGSEGEHFGFADPISQPPIEGADAPSYPGDGVLEPDGTWRPLKPGEFLLGYEDEAGPPGTQTPEPLELRLNGTYVVFRKLYQDVAAFRRYLVTAAKSLYGSDDHYHQDLVAAKIMGRWRSGCPLDLSPDKDDPAIAADPQRRNNFTYEGDEQGLRCPLGAHLRRSNPRATPLKRATAVRRHRSDPARRRVWPASEGRRDRG